MPILNTIKKTRTLSLIFLLFLFFGCAGEGDLQKAREYARQSEASYQQALSQYKTLISQAKDPDSLYFEIGRLYFEHGNTPEAILALEKTKIPQAKKILAISYFRDGRFTDALEIFNKYKTKDDAYSYYCGLTCEKLNLFDQALACYRQISGKDYLADALKRIEDIERFSAKAPHIKEVNPQVNEILLQAPAVEQYPQAGAMILHCDEKVEVSDEGRQVSELHYVIKILNERGKENFAETQIPYDSTNEKVELVYARTIKPDGEVVDVGSRHIRDVSRYLNFPLYSNARVYIISFPEIAAGCAIEYKVRLYNNELIGKKYFVLNYPLQAPEPILNARFSVTLPKAKDLHIKMLNEKYNDFGALLGVEARSEGNNLAYEWTFKDIPQIIPEPDMPPEVEINPTMLMSTFSSWDEVYQWWWPLAQDKIRADNAIKSKVKELIGPKKSPEEKAQAIYDFCARQIRYVAVEYGQAGYEPHKAEEVFRNKYGDCKDQAILLITMLKEAGLESWPVLIPTKEDYDLNADFPAMLFNHCIAALSLGKEIVFLDPTAETCPFKDLPDGDQGRNVFIIREDGFVIARTPLFDAGHNLNRQELKITVRDDGSISGTKTVFTSGIYEQAQRYWLLYTPPQLIKEAIEEALQTVSIGAALDSYDIQNLDNFNAAVILSYSFSGPEYFTFAGDLMIGPKLASLDTSLVSKEQRRYPIDLGVPDTQDNITQIVLPENFVVKYMPQSVSEDSPWLKSSVEYSYKDHKLYCIRINERKKNVVTQAEYPEFKKFLEGLAKKVKENIILEKRK